MGGGGGGGGAGAWNASFFLFVCFFIHFFYTSLSLAGNSSRLNWVKHSRRSVCSIFLCPDNGVAAIVLDFLTCAQMLMHAIAHGDRTDTVRESALEIDSGREKKTKNFAVTGSRTRVSIVPGFSVRRSISWAIPAPSPLSPWTKWWSC